MVAERGHHSRSLNRAGATGALGALRLVLHPLRSVSAGERDCVQTGYTLYLIPIVATELTFSLLLSALTEAMVARRQEVTQTGGL